MTKLADHDLRKWVHSEHTRAKHEILERYLGAWLSIRGAVRRARAYAQLIIFDGLAGRYRGGDQTQFSVTVTPSA